MELYNVYLKLENGKTVSWQGLAQSNRQAEVKALEWVCDEYKQLAVDWDSENA